MDYVSTRNSSNSFTFKDVFIKGLADDGGLFIPKSLQKYALTWFSLAISILLLYLYFRKKNY